MSITLKVVSLIDKLHLQSFFMEKDNKVMLNLSFNPSAIEDVIDDVLKVDGHAYRPNQFEIDVLSELEK
jgi:hypothetical protein